MKINWKDYSNCYSGFDGRIQVSMRPDRPYSFFDSHQAFQTYIGQENWNEFHTTFTFFELAITDIKVTDKSHALGHAPIRWVAYADYYQNRTGDLAKDWETIKEFVSDELIDDMWFIYEQTRDKTLRASTLELEKKA